MRSHPTLNASHSTPRFLGEGNMTSVKLQVTLSSLLIVSARLAKFTRGTPNQ